MLQQRSRLIITAGSGHDGGVHALQLVHLGIINLRKNQLVVQAQCVVAATIERLGGNSAKVAHPGQHHVYQAIKKLVHAVAAQGYHGANRHPRAHFECRNRFLGPRYHRLLAGNLAKLVDRRIQDLGVLGGLAHTHVDHDLMQVGHGHGILQIKFLHQRRSHFLAEPRLQPRRLFGAVARGLRRFGFLLFLAFVFLFFCHCPVTFSHGFGVSPPFVSYLFARSLAALGMTPAGLRRPAKQRHLSSVVPHFLQTRALRSARTSWPIRTGPQVGQTSCTLESEMRLSCSAIPPLTLRCGLGRTCFLTIMTCSTRSLPSSGNTRRTRPSLPLSRPVITFTVSLRRMSTRLCAVVAVAITEPFVETLLAMSQETQQSCVSTRITTKPPAPAKQSSRISSRATRERRV